MLGVSEARLRSDRVLVGGTESTAAFEDSQRASSARRLARELALSSAMAPR
jgi:hypothetical protein